VDATALASTPPITPIAPRRDNEAVVNWSIRSSIKAPLNIMTSGSDE
jgi:hypothetical protein